MKYQKSMVQKKYKEMAAQIKKAELDTRNCTFKPEINREKTPDSSDYEIDRRMLGR